VAQHFSTATVPPFAKRSYHQSHSPLLRFLSQFKESEKGKGYKIGIIGIGAISVRPRSNFETAALVMAVEQLHVPVNVH
jgi:hypothetical protein